MSENPYQAPSLNPEQFPTQPSSPQQAEEIRRAHIKHEASIKSIGTLYYLGGGLLLVGSLITAVVSIAEVLSVKADVALAGAKFGEITVLLIFASVSIVQLFAAYGLRKLKPWARIVAIVISVIGLIGFPLGTIISAYFLYLLLSKKGAFIFSPAYQEIIALTPHVKNKTSIAVWIVLGIVILGIIAMIIGLSV